MAFTFCEKLFGSQSITTSNSNPPGKMWNPKHKPIANYTIKKQISVT